MAKAGKTPMPWVPVYGQCVHCGKTVDITNRHNSWREGDGWICSVDCDREFHQKKWKAIDKKKKSV